MSLSNHRNRRRDRHCYIAYPSVRPSVRLTSIASAKGGREDAVTVEEGSFGRRMHPPPMEESEEGEFLLPVDDRNSYVQVG